MERELLKLFLDIRDNGNITKAANANFITQSTASKQIALLEKELGITLFERGKGKNAVSITPAGERFSDIAERMLLLHQQAMGLKNDPEQRMLTIACINSIQVYTLPPLIRHFQHQHPELSIILEDHHSVEIYPLLENKRIDIGITQVAAPFSDLTSELLFEERYRVVMLPCNPWSGTDHVVHPSELSAKHEIFEAFDTEFQNWHDFWWRGDNSKIHVNTTPTAENYFSSPDDWIVVPETVAYMLEQKNFVSYPLAEDTLRHHVYIAYNKNHTNDLISEFVSSAKEYFNLCSYEKLKKRGA